MAIWLIKVSGGWIFSDDENGGFGFSPSIDLATIFCSYDQACAVASEWAGGTPIKFNEACDE